jgi:CubicO group peptidase (beta-lactamase class C family)
MIIHGNCDSSFCEVFEVFKSVVDSYNLKGAATCIIVGGRQVCHLWTGEKKNGKEWTSDTLVNVYSVSKALVTYCCLLAIQRGFLDLARVS